MVCSVIDMPRGRRLQVLLLLLRDEVLKGLGRGMVNLTRSLGWD